MPKRSIAELLGETNMETLAEGASAAAPGDDGRVEPAEPLSGDVAAQETPLRERPVHPHWQGKPLTESALRELHLWPRTKPAPQAVADSVKAWHTLLAGSKAAHKKGGPREAVQMMVNTLAAMYRTLAAGGGPPRELLTKADHPDLSPTDPDRRRFDGAILLIVKIEAAMAKAYERGGAWREAIQTVTKPNVELADE